LLWAIAPEGATNGQIAKRLGIASHQTVYMLTQDLMRRGILRGERQDRVWVFYAIEPEDSLVRTVTLAAGGQQVTAARFEALASRVLSARYGVVLARGIVSGVRKKFDFVSPDHQVIGDAKYYTRVGGIGLPPAKFSIIAEHVWLLEKTGTRTQFLVFGNERAVPELWLERYGNLVSSVTMYFLSDKGQLEQLLSTA
jgi:hypothetical protein